MAEAIKVVVDVDLLDTETGLWCNDCLLSTGARASLITTVSGRSVLHTRAICTECGQHDIVSQP